MLSPDQNENASLTALAKRYEASTIKHELNLNKLRVEVPCEREYRSITFLGRDSELTQLALQLPTLTSYKFLKGYNGVWSTEDSVVECAIRPAGQSLFSEYMTLDRLGRLFEAGTASPEVEGPNRSSFVVPSPDPNIRIILGLASDAYSILFGARRSSPRLRMREMPRRTTIKISGRALSTHADAKALLEGLGRAILLQIEFVSDFCLLLVPETRDRSLRRPWSEKDQPGGFQAPRYSFDPEAVALYWYARSATEMPLLQFLAYYQVLEFYFPTYSQRDAQARIRYLLKDPAFNVDKDNDLAKLFALAKGSGAGQGYGDERAQLRATVREIVAVQDIIEFLGKHSTDAEYFAGSDGKKISEKRISAKDTAYDIRDQVADRVYDVRCRIVHTKDDTTDRKMLLPFSIEAHLLEHDIRLVRYLAKKALIAASRPLII